MQVALYCANRAIEDSSQCLHLGPTQACLVVAVVAQSAVGWDHFCWNSLLAKIGDLGDTGKLLVNSHHNNLSALAAVRPMVRFPHRAAAVPIKRQCVRRFFYCFVSAE